MRVAIDLDDVCMEFYSSVLKCVEKEYSVTFDYEACTDWDRNDLKETDIFGEGRTWWDWLHDRSWLWAQFPAVQGAVGGVTQLRQQGHYVEALTKKPDWAEWTVWAWLGKWRFPFNTVTIVPSGQAKHEVSPARVLVDDALQNVLPWRLAGRDAILFDRPWNQDAPPLIRRQGRHGVMQRAHGWAEVVDLVNKLDYVEAA